MHSVSHSVPCRVVPGTSVDLQITADLDLQADRLRCPHISAAFYRPRNYIAGRCWTDRHFGVPWNGTHNTRERGI